MNDKIDRFDEKIMITFNEEILLVLMDGPASNRNQAVRSVHFFS